jgi:hypothetical protein
MRVETNQSIPDRKSQSQAASDTVGNPLRNRLQFAKVYTESGPIVIRSEARAMVDDLSEWEKAGPSDIVEAMNEHEDRRKDDQSKPERKIVYH